MGLYQTYWKGHLIVAPPLSGELDLNWQCILLWLLVYKWLLVPLLSYNTSRHLITVFTFKDMEPKTCKLPFVHLFYILFLSHLVFCQLDYNFYDSTCPYLTKIVKYGVWSAIANDTRMAASLVRLHFHDCFVNVMRLSSFFFWGLIILLGLHKSKTLPQTIHKNKKKVGKKMSRRNEL